MKVAIVALRQLARVGSGPVWSAGLWPACSGRSTNAPVWRPALRVGGSCGVATTRPRAAGVWVRPQR